MNFDKFNIRLYFLIISSILVKFQENKKSITMSSIKYLISSLYSLKLCMKNKFVDQMVNIIRFERNLTSMLRIKKKAFQWLHLISKYITLLIF